jgi:hypothetical protein
MDLKKQFLEDELTKEWFTDLTTSGYAELKRKYEYAVEFGLESFEFAHQEFLTAYAKYLLQYMDGKY